MKSYRKNQCEISSQQVKTIRCVLSVNFGLSMMLGMNSTTQQVKGIKKTLMTFSLIFSFFIHIFLCVLQCIGLQESQVLWKWGL